MQMRLDIHVIHIRIGNRRKAGCSHRNSSTHHADCQR